MISKIFFFLSIWTCITFRDYAQTTNRKFKEVKSPVILPVNNRDYEKIGFELITGDESNGVKSIILKDTVIYLLDAFHNNIKKINLITGKVKSSLPLSNKKAWLRDLAVFDKKLFVTTDVEANYILDLNLNLIKTFKLPTQTKYVYKVFKDSLLIYDLGKIIAINNAGTVLDTRNEDIDILKMAHGKKYTIQGNTINTEYGTAHINSSFPYTWKNYYDAINIDFNNKELVYFEVNPKWLKVFLRPIVPK
jgi:hypothetical protein